MFASAWEDLPPDIIEAILYRLPVKSVGRFKLVSKTWHLLISDPTFIKTHLHLRFHQTTKLLLISRISPSSLYSMDTYQLLPCLNNSNDNIDIFATANKLGYSLLNWGMFLGSCNGLVLTKNTKTGTLLLINPTTKEQRKVPPSPFEPTDSDRGYSTCYGFGYNSKTDDYKLVWISYSNHNSETPETYVSLYSLRNNSWKKLPNPPRVILKEFSGAVVNHNYHWLVSSKTEVIVFSFADEVFSEIKLPNVLQNPNTAYIDVIEVSGKLGYYIAIRGVSYRLWLMHEYGNTESWTIIFSHEFTYPVWPVCSVEGSNRNIMLADTAGENLFIFSIDEKICRNVRIVGAPSRFLIGHTFVESIESPKRFITTP